MSASAARPGPRTTPLADRRVQRAAGNRALVEQAKGVLVHRFRLEPDEAFELLRRWAHETGSTVLVVAQTLVYAVCLDEDVAARDRDVLDHLTAALQEQTRESPHVPGPRLRAAEARDVTGLDVQVRFTPDLPIVQVGGRLDRQAVPRLLDALRSVVAACPAALAVLDLGGLTSCDVEALPGLEEAAALVADVGMELVLYSVPAEVERLITETGVATALERH